MASKYRIVYNDYSKGKDGKPEQGAMEIRILDLNAGNLAASITALGDLLTATQAISLGLLAHETITLSDTYSNAGFATDKAAQREQKWLVSMEDNTSHNVYSFTIPCADTSLLANNNETLDLSAGAGQTFKQKLEAVYRTKEGNAGTVISVKYVGRNL